MALIPDLIQTQVGKETAWGTAVAATAKLMGIEKCEIEADLDISHLKEQRASLAGNFVATANTHKGKAKVSGVVTYEDMPYWNNSLFGEVAPTGANPYAYINPAPLAAAPSRRSMTLISGQTGEIRKLAGGIVDELTYKIEANKPWMFEASLLGKTVSAGSLASLNDRTVVPVHANVTTLYLDTFAGTMGATALSGVIFYMAELSIKSNAGLSMGIGSINPATYRDAAYKATLKLRLECNTTTAGYVTSVLGSSPLQQQISIKGTTGASAIAQLDFSGTHTKSPKFWDDEDGVTVFEFEMENTYNPGAFANWGKISFTNAVSTLP